MTDPSPGRLEPPTDPMRVLHCYSGNLYGGIEAMLATLARCRDLAPGMEPHFALCFEGRLADELRAAAAPVHLLNPVRFRHPWTALAARRRLARLLRRVRPDVVICHASWPHGLLGPVALRAGRPLIYWQHNLIAVPGWVDRLAARVRPRLVVANSHATAATTPRLFPDAAIEVVYCPVAAPGPAAGDRGEVRRELDTPEHAVVLIQVSRLEPLKGHDLLLEALGRLRGSPGWVAWIVGGPQRPAEHAYLAALRARAAALGIADRVRFLGQRADVPRLLAAADVSCQPNAGAESFGIAPVEALYAGLPVVATRLGGVAEVLDATCGVLVPPGDAAALAAALGQLIADPEARARLGAAGPMRAAALCDPAQVLDRLRAVLAPVAGCPAMAGAAR